MIYLSILHFHVCHDLLYLILCYTEWFILTVLFLCFLYNHPCWIYELTFLYQLIDNCFYLFIICIFQIRSRIKLSDKIGVFLCFLYIMINSCFWNSILLSNLLNLLMLNYNSINDFKLFNRLKNRSSSTSSTIKSWNFTSEIDFR